MAAVNAASSSTELKCKNCLKVYQLKGSSGRRPLLPLLLNCGHTFCSQCVPKFSPPSTSSIRCPMCQAVAPYNPKVDSSKQIPPNLHLLGLLYCKQHSLPSVASESAAGKIIMDPDLWTKLTPVPLSPGALDDMTKPCEECRKVTRHKCRQCGVPLCKECFRLTHSAAVFLRKHELIAVLSSTFSTCPLHELPMDRFCSSDRVTFCSECASNHKGHEVALIVDKGGEMHDKLKPLLDTARKMLRSMKRSHATVSDEGLASLKEQLFQLMDKVEEQFILLHTTLQARYLQLMNGLALVAEMQAANLQAICHKLKDGMDRLTDTMTYIQEVSEDSSQLVQCGDRIVAELNILLELPCSLHSAEKEPLRCNLDDSVYEAFKDYGTVVSPKKAWYTIGNVMADSDNDTPRSMSEAEEDNRTEPDTNIMDVVREGVEASGSDDDDEAESLEGEKVEEEGSEGPGTVTMDTSLTPTHSTMDTTPREEDGSEGDDSEEDNQMVADTSASREAHRDINLSGSPFHHNQRQDGGLLYLPQNHMEGSHVSPLSTTLTPLHPPQVGSSWKKPSPGGAVLKGSTVEKSPLKEAVSSDGRGSNPFTSGPSQDSADRRLGKEGLEVEAEEDEGSQVPQKGGHDDSLVRVVHVDNPGKFFVRYNREVSQFDKVMGQLNAEHWNRVKMRAKEISLGTLCAASYSGGEGRLYRAEVSSLPTKVFPFYTVKYIDHGNQESVTLERLFHLPPNMATILPLAHCCKLAHIAPIQIPSKYPDIKMPAVWGERATLNFKAQSNGKELKLEVVSCESDCLAVDLYLRMVTEWVSVAERLVNKGLAQWEESADGENEEEDNAKEEEGERILPVQEIPFGTTLLDCVVCEAKSPDHFYIQILGSNVSELQDLMDQLQQEALISQRVTRPASGVLCMGLFTDGLWYRANIEDMSQGKEEVTVRYVDFGNVERVPVDQLRRINSSLLNLRAQAIPCALSGVVPMGEGAEWSEEACHFFSSTLTNKRVQAEVVEEGGGAGGVLKLNITDPPIADNLVADKLAMYSGPIVFPPPTLPQSGDVCRGFIVHVETPSLFHVRKYDPAADQTLENLLQQVSPPPSSHALTWSSGDCCCTHFFQDANWHRAVVTQQTQNESEYEVYYVDYGNLAVVKVEDMVPILLPELLTIPQQALCCRLANVRPLEEAWSTGACVFLSTAVMNQLVVMETKDVDLREAAPLSVEISLLFSEACSSGPMKLSDSLLDNGYALSSNTFHLQLYDGPSYRSHPLPDDNPFKMMVICVQNDGQVVGQLEENQAELEALMEKVQVVCRKNKNWLGGLGELKRGQPCCAKFSEDNLWYRAVVDGIMNGKALVCYVDFGNCEEVPVDCIVPKSVCMDVTSKSICLQIAQTESLTWNESVAQVLTEIVSDRQCTVHLKEPFEVAGSAYGSLQLDTGEDVLQLLMEQLQK